MQLSTEMRDPAFQTEYKRLMDKYGRDEATFQKRYGGDYSKLRAEVRRNLKKRKP